MVTVWVDIYLSAKIYISIYIYKVYIYDRYTYMHIYITKKATTKLRVVF